MTDSVVATAASVDSLPSTSPNAVDEDLRPITTPGGGAPSRGPSRGPSGGPSSYCGNPKDAIEKGFRLVQKPKLNSSSYQLYHDTINAKRAAVYKSALDAYNSSAYESCLACISKGLFLDPDNVDYYVLGGDTYLGMKNYKSAILYYKRVCILKPDNEEHFTKLAHIYFLHGESYFEEKSFLEALECYTRASEMRPENSEYHSRSIDCLASLNRHNECLAFVNKRLTVEPENVKLLVFRAKLHLLFSNSTLSYFDVMEALRIEPDNGEVKLMLSNLEKTADMLKERAEQLDLDGKVKEGILKISQAIATNPLVTEYHVVRAGMYRRVCNFNAAVDDILLAMDKLHHDASNPAFKNAQKQLLLTFNDFAVQCFNKGFYEEAIVLLEKAIKGEKSNKALYMNRGDCFLKLDHLHFALLDYQQAEELDVNDKSVGLRLSVVYNELGILDYRERKYPKAEDYFSLAISYNPGVPTYYVSRGRARYMTENLLEAKVDIVSALYLDPENKEVSSMFSRLFPAKTVPEVLDSEFGKLVIEALQSVLCEQSSGTPPDEGRSSTKLVSPLNKTTVLPDIETRLCLNEKLKQCMEDEEFHFSIIKGKKMVNELVETVIQSKQDLSYKGPSVMSNAPSASEGGAKKVVESKQKMK